MKIVKALPSPPRQFATVLWIFFAALYLVVATTPPAAAIEWKSFFKRQKFDAHENSVNLNEAVRILSDYRAEHGLAPVKLDPTLIRIAADHAVKMAAADRVKHALPGQGSFARRLRTGGYEASTAAENIGAGYDDLNEAFASWRKSPDHNKNLLRPDISVIGIAMATAAGSTYGTYWSLVLADPYEPPSAPSAGPQGLIIGR